MSDLFSQIAEVEEEFRCEICLSEFVDAEELLNHHCQEIFVAETKWFYLVPNGEFMGEEYGYYSSQDMLIWLQAGYFNNDLQLRTENESSYHTLGEWIQLVGTHPFGMPVHSLIPSIIQVFSIRRTIRMMLTLFPPPPPFPNGANQD